MSDEVHAVPFTDVLEGKAEKTSNPGVDTSEEVSESSVPSPDGVEGLFSAKVFDVRNDFFSKLNPESVGQLQVIDDFILGKMSEQQIKITDENFRGIMEEVMKMMDIPEGLPQSVKILEVFKAIKLANFLK